MSGRHISAAAAFVVALAFAASDASSQVSQSRSPPVANSLDRDKPVTIRAARLEVRDKDKIATFAGDVHLIQGEMNLRCKVLVVYYEGEMGAAAAPAPAESGGQQQIKRMLAKGGVVVTQKDQVATGENGDFDMRANKGTLTGNVVLTQGQNVIRGGKRLIVDMTTGVYTVEGGGGRLEMLVDSKAATTDPKQGQGQGQPQALTPPPPRQGRRN